MRKSTVALLAAALGLLVLGLSPAHADGPTITIEQQPGDLLIGTPMIPSVCIDQPPCAFDPPAQANQPITGTATAVQGVDVVNVRIRGNTGSSFAATPRGCERDAGGVAPKACRWTLFTAFGLAPGVYNVFATVYDEATDGGDPPQPLSATATVWIILV